MCCILLPTLALFFYGTIKIKVMKEPFEDMRTEVNRKAGGPNYSEGDLEVLVSDNEGKKPPYEAVIR